MEILVKLIGDLDKKGRTVVAALLVALGLTGGAIYSAQSIGPVWPNYSDRLCSYDRQLCPSWLSLAAGGDLQAQSDDMWIGRDSTNSIAFNTTTDVITTSANGGLFKLIGGVYPALVGGHSSNVYSGIGAEVLFGGYSGAPNSIVGGSGGNTISGGGNNAATSTGSATIGGGALNAISGGTQSTIGGGVQNKISMDLPIYNASVIGGGTLNVITDTFGVNTGRNVIGGGEDNDMTSSWLSVIDGGEDNRVANAGEGAIGGGYGNYVSASFGTIPGGGMSVADSYGELSYASGSFGGYADMTSRGQAQASLFVARRAVTHSNTNWYALFTDGSSTRMTIPSNGLWSAEIQMVGLTSGAPQRFAYHLVCSAVNDGGTTTLLYSSATVLSESDANYDVRCMANDPNDSLDIEVQNNGGTAYTIRWIAIVRVSQVIY